MSEHFDQPVSAELVEVMRRLIAVNERIAQSLTELEKLYTEDRCQQEELRKELNEKQSQWEAEAKRSRDKPLKLPPLPWPLRFFWCLLILTLFLVVVLLLWHLVDVIKGSAAPLS